MHATNHGIICPLTWELHVQTAYLLRPESWMHSGLELYNWKKSIKTKTKLKLNKISKTKTETKKKNKRKSHWTSGAIFVLVILTSISK